jgi:TP901 family phage tail tape measure protein
MGLGIKVASLFATIGLEDKMTGALEKAHGSLENFGGGIPGIGAALGGMAVAGVAAAGAIGVASVAMAAKFDSSLKNIQAVTGKTNEEMQALAGELNSLGANSVAGPQKVAEAMYDIVGGVADASTHTAILKAALATSEAGAADLQSTTQGLISVMNSYGYKADQAALVSDVFTSTVGKGVGTMDQFVAALGPITGLASQVGVDFKQLGTAAAFMTTQGFTASAAATRLQAAMTALLKPNSQMTAGLRRMGVESGQAALQQYGLAGTLQRLEKAFQGNTQRMAEALGSTEALGAAMALTKDNFDEFAADFENGLNGATAAAQKVQLSSFNNQLTLLKNHLEAAGVALGSAVLPHLNGLLTLINNGINILPNLGKIVTELFKDVVPKDPFGIEKALNGLNASIQGPIKTIKDTLQNAFNTIFDNGPTPDQVRLSKKLGEVLPETLPFGERISKAINEALPKVQAAVGELLTNVGTWIGTQAQKFIDGFNTLLGQAGDWMSSGGPTRILNGLQGLISQAATWLSTTGWNNFKTGVEALFTAFQGWIGSDGPQKFINGLGSAFSQVGSWLASNAWNTIKAGAEALFTAFQGWISSDGPGKLIGGVTTALINLGNWLAGTAWTLVSTGLEGLFNGIKGWIESGGPGKLIGGITTALLNVAGWLAGTAWTLLSSGIDGLFNGIKDWIKGNGPAKFTEGLLTVIGNVSTWLVETAPKQIEKGVSDFFTEVGKFFSAEGSGNTIIEKIKEVVTNAWNWVKGDGLKLAESAFNAAIGAVKSIINGIGDGIIAAFKNGLRGILNAVKLAAPIIPGGWSIAEGLERALDGAKATGGQVGPGDWLVGERGPELLHLEGGQHGEVLSNSWLMNAGKRGAGAGSTTINLYNPVFQGVQDAAKLLAELDEVASRSNMTVLTPL